VATVKIRPDADGSAACQALACLDYWPDLYDTLVWAAVMDGEFDLDAHDLGGES